jgi:hypothetical protein
MKIVTLALATAVLTTGCATSSFVLNGQAGDVATKATTEHYFVSGLGQAKETNAAAVCGGASKVAKVEVTTRPLDALLSGITYGIYTPRAASVYCSK